MKFFTRFLAIIGGLVVLGLIAGVALGLSVKPEDIKLPAGKLIVSIDFANPEGIQGPSQALSSLLNKRGFDVPDIVRAIDLARLDPNVVGFTARVSDVPFEDLADVEEIRAAVARFTEAGKYSSAWADTFGELGPANREYWLASAFGHVWLQPHGMLGLTGPSMSLPFARGLLDKLGITPNIHTRYEFKGAMSNFSDAKMSDPLRQNYTRLLNDIFSTIVSDVAASRKLKIDEVKKLVNQAPLLADRALAGKLIDGLLYENEANEKATEAGKEAHQIGLVDYLNVKSHELHRQKKIAEVGLISVTGPIVRRDTSGGGLGGNSDMAAADVIASAIQEASEQKNIQALLVRVNSPGGSVAASETIRHALEQAQNAGKYVLISMGGTAASGGYWISTASNWIMADRTTLTGSIGVLAGKMSVGDLGDKVGIHWDSVATGANSTMWNPDTGFSPSATAALNLSLDETYATFIDHVSQSRHLSPEKLDKLARGRVWSGLSGRDEGLVDEIGGFRDALLLLKKRFGGDESSLLTLREFPEPLSPMEELLRNFRNFAEKSHPFGVFSYQKLEKIAQDLIGSPDGLVQQAPRLKIH